MNYIRFIKHINTNNLNMKKLTLLLLVLITIASCTSEKKEMKYTLKINADTAVDGYAYLKMVNPETGEKMIILDSAIMEEGIFQMKGEFEYPFVGYIYLPVSNRAIPIFLDEGDIVVDVYKDNYASTKITGSAAQDEFQAFRDELGVFNDKMKDLYILYKLAKEEENTDKMDSLSAIMDEIYEEEQVFIKNHVKTNNSNVTSPYIAYSNSYSWTIDELDEVVQNFDPSLVGLPDYKKLADRLVVLKRVDIGQPLVDFTQKDSNNVDITLSEISKGKYMLVDFWASWCGPCRAENPNIVACYNDFHDKGFDVFGVSFDDNRERWIQAIHDDALAWHHVSDLGGWNNAAGKLYGIRSIPSNILLDPDGIIIARDLRGEELRVKLEELMP